MKTRDIIILVGLFFIFSKKEKIIETVVPPNDYWESHSPAGSFYD